MKLYTILFLLLMSLLISTHAQVTEEWVKRINGPANGSDHGHDVATDQAGFVYVTGWIETASGNPDCHTVKYSENGDLLWAKTYAGSASGTDYGYTIAVDDSGNAYVGGFGNGNAPVWDIFIIKYNTDGDTVWVRRWRSPLTNYSAYSYSIAVDGAGNVYTTGFMSDGITGGEFITLKYNAAGVLQWSKSYKGPGVSIDYANCVIVDYDGNVYITGWSGGENNMHDMTTIKYSPDGDSLWVKRYNGSADDNDYAYWLDIDEDGNIYVTGQSVETGSDNDATTIKYSPDGEQLWIRHYNGPANGYDAAWALAVDMSGNVYVTGNHTTSTGLDCMTLKYSAQGELLWSESYNGPGNGGDVLLAIVLDDSSNAYVTGFVSNGGASDFVTIRYSESGNQDWLQLYNGGTSYDGTYAITIDHRQNVYITGYSTGNGTDYDYTTIRYSQPTISGVEDIPIPAGFSLSQNYPNPFNPSTRISYSLSEESRVKISVYNILGELAEILVDDIRPQGVHEAVWSPATEFNSGIYIYKIEAESLKGEVFKAYKKMLMLK